ncbi:hypothetical protein Bbelb_176070 [Branchiostoma belcheri]|nr:hypothetical protein Bbelb_176070 [Branchiostoma belcheri]
MFFRGGLARHHCDATLETRRQREQYRGVSFVHLLHPPTLAGRSQSDSFLQRLRIVMLLTENLKARLLRHAGRRRESSQIIRSFTLIHVTNGGVISPQTRRFVLKIREPVAPHKHNTEVQNPDTVSSPRHMVPCPSVSDPRKYQRHGQVVRDQAESRSSEDEKDRPGWIWRRSALCSPEREVSIHITSNLCKCKGHVKTPWGEDNIFGGHPSCLRVGGLLISRRDLLPIMSRTVISVGNNSRPRPFSGSLWSIRQMLVGWMGQRLSRPRAQFPCHGLAWRTPPTDGPSTMALPQVAESEKSLGNGKHKSLREAECRHVQGKARSNCSFRPNSVRKRRTVRARDLKPGLPALLCLSFWLKCYVAKESVLAKNLSPVNWLQAAAGSQVSQSNISQTCETRPQCRSCVVATARQVAYKVPLREPAAVKHHTSKPVKVSASQLNVVQPHQQ